MTGTLLTFVCCRLFFGFTINNLYLHLVYFSLLFFYKLAALQCGAVSIIVGQPKAIFTPNPKISDIVFISLDNSSLGCI